MANSEIFWAVIIITAVLLLLVGISAFTFYRMGKLRVQQQVTLTKARLDFEKELRKTETEITEHLLSHYSRELHDSVGQLLSAANFHVRGMKLEFPVLKENFETLESYLSDASTQVRTLSRTLNNDYTGRIGLIRSLDLEIERLKSLDKFKMHWKTNNNNSNLNPNQELMVFRIFQEVTQNAMRHSGAENLFVNLDTSGNQFEMIITDDGRGYSHKEMMNSEKAHGIKNIVKRASMADLVCEISSAPGEGCTIALKKNDV